MIPTLAYSTLRAAWEATVAQAKACDAAGLVADALLWERHALDLHKVLRAFEAHRILPAPKPLPAEPLPGDVPLALTLLESSIEASLSALDSLEAGVSVAPPAEDTDDDCPC